MYPVKNCIRSQTWGLLGNIGIWTWKVLQIHETDITFLVLLTLSFAQTRGSKQKHSWLIRNSLSTAILDYPYLAHFHLSNISWHKFKFLYWKSVQNTVSLVYKSFLWALCRMLSRPFKERVSGRQVQRIGTQTHMNEDSLPQPPNKGTYFDINYINYY